MNEMDFKFQREVLLSQWMLTRIYNLVKSFILKRLIIEFVHHTSLVSKFNS